MARQPDLSNGHPDPQGPTPRGANDWSTAWSPSDAGDLLDDTFVTRAAFTEPSAIEPKRKATASANRSSRRGMAGLLHHRFVPWIVIAVVVSLSPLLRVGASPDAGLPDTLQLFVAIPADGDLNYGLVDAAEHEVALAVDWLQTQTGQHLRGDVGFGYIVELSSSGADLRGDADIAYQRIMDEVVGQQDPDVFPVVMADVRTESLDHGIQTCGLGGPLGIVVFLGNCRGFEPTSTSVWGSHASHTLAHEILHGLGAVQACAPNATGTGHVGDDQFDVLYQGPFQRESGDVVVMDATRNDYWDHGIPGCPDIMDSPLWE